MGDVAMYFFSRKPSPQVASLRDQLACKQYSHPIAMWADFNPGPGYIREDFGVLYELLYLRPCRGLIALSQRDSDTDSLQKSLSLIEFLDAAMQVRIFEIRPGDPQAAGWKWDEMQLAVVEKKIIVVGQGIEHTPENQGRVEIVVTMFAYGMLLGLVAAAAAVFVCYLIPALVIVDLTASILITASIFSGIGGALGALMGAIYGCSKSELTPEQYRHKLFTDFMRVYEDHRDMSPEERQEAYTAMLQRQAGLPGMPVFPAGLGAMPGMPVPLKPEPAEPGMPVLPRPR